MRRHAYIQQTFAAPEALGERAYRHMVQRVAAHENATAARGSSGGAATLASGGSGGDATPLATPIHVLVPLRGRSPTFSRFVANLRAIMPADETAVELLVICYKCVRASRLHSALERRRVTASESAYLEPHRSSRCARLYTQQQRACSSSAEDDAAIRRALGELAAFVPTRRLDMAAGADFSSRSGARRRRRHAARGRAHVLHGR